jgi:hypothetical protein
MRVLGKGSLSSFLSAILTITSIGLAIVVAIAMVLLVASPWVDLGGNGRLGIPVALQIDGRALHLGAPSLGAGSATLKKVTGTLEFVAPSKRALVTPMLTMVAMLLLAYWAVQQLRKLFRALRDGQVFAAANVRRVQRVGWAVILAEPVRALITYSAQDYARSHFVGDGIRFVVNFDLNLGTIFAGLAILVIAEVFRAGARLAEDQSLTI